MSTPETTNPENAAALAKNHPVMVFRDYFDRKRDALSQIIPSTLSLDRVMKVALGAYARTPDLWQCSIESVYQAINQSVQLGLEPGGPLGQAYIVPFKNKQTGKKEATLITGYKGLITLMRRSGEVATVEAHVVHQGDFFDCQLGTDGYLKHKPVWDKEPGPMVAVYAIVTTKDGYKTWEVMRKSQIDAIRNGSPGKNSPAWTNNYEEMARKTVIRRVAKFAPMSIEAATALSNEDDAEARGEPVDVSGLADGALVLPPEEEESQQQPTPEPRPASQTNDRPQAAPTPTPPTNAQPDAAAAPKDAPPGKDAIKALITSMSPPNPVGISKAREAIEKGYIGKAFEIDAVRDLFSMLLARCSTKGMVNQAADLMANISDFVPEADGKNITEMTEQVEDAKKRLGAK